MEALLGIVRGFDGQTYRADVQLVGSRQTALTGVDVSRAIPAAEMQEGRRCAVARLSPHDPAAAVLFAVWE